MKRIERALSAIRATRKGLGPARLLLAAAVFHAAVTVAVFGLGRYGLLPGTFNRDGIAVSFAPDGLKFQAAAVGLSEALRRGDFAGWANANEPFHVKPYSICFALFGGLAGTNVVSAEPLNVLYYLLILVLVFELGREAFGRRAGLLAAAAVALWPSLLIHTTQLLRDQLFLIGMLTYVLILQRWLTRGHSWPGALLWGTAGGLAAAVVWLARDNLAAIMLAAALLGAGLLVARQLLERRARPAALAGMALTLALSVCVMKVVPTYQKPDNPNHPRPGGEEEIKAALSGTPWGRAAAYVAVTRHRFIRLYPDAGSNIDNDVQFNGLADILRYAPRAAAVGFFAPFPDMWFTSGKTVGSAGRLLVGVETLLMYLVEALAVYGLWSGRRRLSAWLLFLLSAVGMFALGLVVTNVGALYRIRYLFLILLMVLAAEGGARLLGRARPAPECDT
ncbi:MAG TPA: hypothetical protein VJ866_16110 [Pyrinomonadaceae bacterium]|nr:hypothetical protein [Pyrinomonadaceae bacterium]